MHTKRELLVAGPTYPIVRRTGCGTLAIERFPNQTRSRLGDVPLENELRSPVAADLATRSRELNSLEAFSYIALWACGLIAIALCL